MKAIKIIKETYSPRTPLWNGEFQLPHPDCRPDSVVVRINLDSKCASIRDEGTYNSARPFVTPSEFNHRVYKIRSRIRFISRGALASLICELRPLLREIFAADEMSAENYAAIEHVLNNYVDESAVNEADEMYISNAALADAIKYEEKLSPEWIRNNLKPDALGYYDVWEWQDKVESESGAGIEQLLYADFDVIETALFDARIQQD